MTKVKSMRFDDVLYFHSVEYSPYKEPSRLSGGQIAGIVLGCVALVAVIIAVIIMARKGMFKIPGIFINTVLRLSTTTINQRLNKF